MSHDACGVVTAGHGVIVAHPSPSVRMRIASFALERQPVFLTNGASGLCYQLERVLRGVIRAPRVIFVGEAELELLRSSPLWEAVTRLPLTLVLVAPAGREAVGVHRVYDGPPAPAELETLLQTAA